MQIVIIILLVILVGFFLWDRLRAGQRWKEQSDILSKTVGERIADTTKVFGEVKERLGELTQRTKEIQEVEALSRGADWVDFVDHEPRCCDIIKQNLEKTKLTAQAHIYCCGVAKAISFLDKEYSIILMDPPYFNSSISNIVTQLATSKLVGINSIIVVTHSPHVPLNSTYATLNLVKQSRHGDSCIAVYQKEGNL